MAKKIRVLVAKPGLDPHERGAKVVATALRDSGMEVIYLGGRVNAAMIVDSAIQEDVDIIGLSILSGAHITHSKNVIQLLKERVDDKIMIIVGGIIPEEDIALLENLGISKVFTPGTTMHEIIKYIKEKVNY